MTWARLSIGALLARLRAAVNGHRAASAHGPASSATQSADISGPALHMSRVSAPAGKPHTDLRARAERQCNRNRRLVARYLAVHETLMNGRAR
jgi:hypothetical protein